MKLDGHIAKLRKILAFRPLAGPASLKRPA